MEVYIARQPIFDDDYNVLAYELLYRDSLENVFNGRISDDVATALVLTNSYFNFGIERLTMGTSAFINFDKSLILHGIPELLDKDHVTIELLETIDPDPALLSKLTSLKAKGYRIALDDFTYDGKTTPLLDYIDILKVDFRANSREKLLEIVKSTRDLPIDLLAEKVETREEFQWARDQGFCLFQGFYFAKPSIQMRKTMDHNGLVYLQVMEELNKVEPDYKVLSDIIMMDVSLTYKLLKLANANMKPINEIKSIQQALAVLGVKNFKRWLSMAMIQGMSRPETDEAVKLALIRSNLLVKISEASNMKEDLEELSLMGILSVLDVVLEMTMADILETLPIAEEMKQTLLGQMTRYAYAMRLCFAYEKGDFEDVEVNAENIGYDLNRLPEHYVSAISWAEKTFREMKQSN